MPLILPATARQQVTYSKHDGTRLYLWKHALISAILLDETIIWYIYCIYCKISLFTNGDRRAISDLPDICLYCVYWIYTFLNLWLIHWSFIAAKMALSKLRLVNIDYICECIHFYVHIVLTFSIHVLNASCFGVFHKGIVHPKLKMHHLLSLMSFETSRCFLFLCNERQCVVGPHWLSFMRVSKWWNKFNLWVNYPFKRKILQCTSRQ